MTRTWFPRLQGNSRGCLAFEPFFLIPYSMVMTYATLYMYELGVSETAIGWITTLSLIVQVFSSFVSGYLTDRMGRKAAVLYFDLLSWTLAAIIWAVSQNVWFFVAAALLNGFQRIPATAFYCLVVEDTRPSDRTYVFTLLQVISVIGGLFAPLGGLLVYVYGLVPGTRIMYILAALLMTFQFVGRHLTTRETEMGYRKMKETREVGLGKSLLDYAGAIREITSSRSLLLIFSVYVLFNFQTTLKATYLSLYLADYLRISSDLISLVPALSSVVMLLVIWLLTPRIPETAVYKSMMAGFALSVLSNIMLVIGPITNLYWIAASTIIAAIGLMISSPYLEAAVANAIDDEKRAKIFSMLSVLILLITSPAGIIGGWAYTLDPRIPIILIIMAFVVAYFLILYYQRQAIHSLPPQKG